MPLSLNEIRRRANAFSKEWADAFNEDAEAKEFLIQFLDIFGITRRRVATFEHRVKKLDDGDGYIDLLWKGTILVEMKSRGKDMAKAYQQAKDYCHGLKEHEVPKMILICDFQRFHVYDENGNKSEFTLDQLSVNLHLFDVLRGLERRVIKEEDPVNLQAAELMGQLHDKLKDIGYDGHALELYLVRLLFLLFADDTGIFDRGSLYDYLRNNTKEDGSDLAFHIAGIFDVLNREHEKRFKNLDEDLARFPYVNGKLFEEQLPPASFDSDMRNMLLQASLLDWGKISPAIFGSLFQSVMDPKARRNLGAHYTSEKNILKLIGPLFLDELKEDYKKVRHNKNELRKLHARMANLRFLDPACGCGNFLIITYRELRLLEMDVVKDILEGQTVTDIGSYFLLDVDQFYGIEYEEFPAQIAQVAMWLMDHQMNVLASQRFGDYYIRLPLRKSATIRHGNALRIEWQSLLPEGKMYDYIMGNPPFIGARLMNSTQKEDLSHVFANSKKVGNLDYVSGWYSLAADYSDTHQSVRTGFVSTNSICQGEQVGILWQKLFTKNQLQIRFAHQTFRWSNEAKGKAAVFCVIIGFDKLSHLQKRLFIYDNVDSEPSEFKVKQISPYLIEGKSNLLFSRSTPICNVPFISFGSMPNDGGAFLFSDSEKIEFLRSEPKAAEFFKPIISAHEFINGEKRWCLWLKNIRPEVLKSLPLLSERVNKVREIRTMSTRESTKKLADFPTLFGEDRQPNSNYILIPRHSSENRKYIPIAFFTPDYIVSDSCLFVADASLFHFGVMTSSMHMSWVKTTCGRIKSDFRYSNTIVYNNFPWPLTPSEKQKQAVEEAAQAVLNARAQFPNNTLADLYVPNTMPPVLVKAHQALDKAVELCYRPQPFPNESKRIEYLFDLYDQYTAGLFAKEKKKGGKK